ncbi:MAG TPA: tetratricopeptide repeat protein [Pyrinomonadaceae bacterium]|nr:tetratricopeptide repeat protein [Pyrinomonadaceae bacterium]
MNSRKMNLCFLVLLMFFISAVNVFAQGHSIRGKVRNADGTSIRGATVVIERNGATIDQTVTNNEGDFFFSGLTDTSYTLIASVADYNPGRESVEFVRPTGPTSPGETRTIEITLTSKEIVRPPRAGLNFVQDVPKTARDAFDAGVKLSRAKRREEAIAAYETALKHFPNYFDARFILATELAAMGRFQEAITHLEEARKINPRDDRVYDLFARIMIQERKYAVAARIYAEAERLSPNDPQYPLSRGTAFIEQASMIDPSKSAAAADERNYALAEAEKALKQAQQVGSRKLPEVHLQLARVYEKKGEQARAADELEQYLRKNPNASNAAAIREAIKILRSAGPNKPKQP